LLVYGALAVAILGYSIYEVGRGLWVTGLWPLRAALILAGVMSISSIVRDVHRRQLSWASRGLLVAWVVCVALLVLADLVA